MSSPKNRTNVRLSCTKSFFGAGCSHGATMRPLNRIVQLVRAHQVPEQLRSRPPQLNECRCERSQAEHHERIARSSARTIGDDAQPRSGTPGIAGRPPSATCAHRSTVSMIALYSKRGALAPLFLNPCGVAAHHGGGQEQAAISQHGSPPRPPERGAKAPRAERGQSPRSGPGFPPR